MMSPFQPLSLADRQAGTYPAVAAPRSVRPLVASTATPAPRSPVATATPVRPPARARATVARRDIRATIAALPGRGEDPAIFDALADRLALDGYLLTVVPDGGNRVSALVEGRVPGTPFVLLGSDTGALAALAMVGSPAVRPDGLVLLGLPLLHLPVAGLPVEEPSPRALPDLPILLLHGADDEISPLPLVRMTTRTAPRAELDVVLGGHDVLTGSGRRSVAARTVLFLESLLDA
ncbi:Alpha/beta hydrolase family [Frankia torreyi]|uniref:Alpha/beta hydrolase family n=1 Tax=Frankia torreyi TaxID=1856 RepID=A0A0D8BJU5_9ACTN|nr:MULTISPECIES: alpha/beta hydrolase [Frankia]KJE24269.1 Alpha/beta hydrolase family [Frankia torreyi]